MLVGVRNDSYLERVLGGVTYREADAIDRHRTLVHGEWGKPNGVQPYGRHFPSGYHTLYL